MNSGMVRQDWKDYCRLSLVHFMAFPELQSGEGPFVASIQQAAELGIFGALELGPIHQDTVRREVKSITRDLGISIGFGAQPVILSQGLDLNHPDETHREHALRRLFTAADQAFEVGAESFVVLSGKDPAPRFRPVAYQYLSESLKKLADYSESLGMQTVLEIFDRCIDKKALVGPADEAAALADMIRTEHPGFGLLYDMGHMPLLEETPEYALPILASYLTEVHLGNCIKTEGHPAYGDKHPRVGYPGGINGIPELVHFIRTLFEISYLKPGVDPDNLPWVGFEVRPQPGETTSEILLDIKNTWEAAWYQATCQSLEQQETFNGKTRNP